MVSIRGFSRLGDKMLTIGSLFSGIGGIEWGLELSGIVRQINMPLQSLENIGQRKRILEILQKSIGEQSKDQIFSVEDSLAKTSVSPGKEQESKKAQDQAYGRISMKRLGYYDQASSSLKTYQKSLITDSHVSLQTLPKKGMMRNGLIYELLISEHCIDEKESLLLPTVTKDSTTGRTKRYKQGGIPLTVALLPTIGKNEYKGSGRARYKGSKDFRGAKMSEGLRTCKEDPIYLNPLFAEKVMGFPIGWTELPASEMQSCQK